MDGGEGLEANAETERPRGMWVWVKIKPPGIGPQVLVQGSMYHGSILGTDF